MSYCVMDLETTTATYMKRKANPFYPDNFVVAAGWRKFNQQTEHRYEGTGFIPNLREMLEGTRMLVGHNIKFDILFLITRSEDNLEAWMEYVANGGTVWDTQLAEFMLNGQPQEDQMLALNELAPRYGGNAKIDEVKAMWEAGIDTPDIPKQLLLDYLLGRTLEDGTWEEGDIGNTEKVFRAQLDRAKKQGQMKSILLNMGSLLATTEMERNGLYVDVALGLKLAEGLAAELSTLQEGLQQYLPKDLPFEFNWASRWHLSPLIFGGVVNYERREWDLADGRKTNRDPETIPKDHERYEEFMGMYAWGTKDEDHYILEDGGTCSMETWDYNDGLGADMPPIATYKSGKNAGMPKTKKVKVPDWTKPKTRMAKYQYEFKGVTEPNQRWASSTAGLYSVAAEVIEELGSRNIPFLKDLARVAKISKDLGTYYISTDKQGNQKGMLAMVGPDGIIHHSINHTNVVTLRFSSSNPNLQNVPRGDTSDVKSVFVSRFLEGVVIQSDFTALEVYVQAILTMCKNLINDLRNGLDMHCVRVSQVTEWAQGKTYEEIVQLAKKDQIPEWVSRRTGAKEFSFQRAYGAGVAAIAASTGMPEDTIRALIAAEEENYPEIAEYFDRRQAEVEFNRVDQGRYVQHPDFPHLTCNLGKSWVKTPDGKLYSYQEQPAPEFKVKQGTIQGFKPTEIKNYEVQGGGAEWAKAAMWLAVREYYRRRNWGGLALLINQVHDALYSDACMTVAEEAAQVLHACMLEASTFMEWYFDWEIPVHVPAETMMGSNMKDERPPKAFGFENFEAGADVFRKDIRQRYMGGYVPSYNTLH